MKTYLVGGAVRDSLLDIPVKDKDFVVVGSTPKQMLDAGYMQVGKDFPVFLHPKTKEEYALARMERKQGQGYHGFALDYSSKVTLEEDLLRRDLTINAIAQDTDGNLTDPFNGVSDINNKILRHVSDAFVEDPLRVLRVARFAARFAHLGFVVADETLLLMQQISQSGELATLTPERVWQETHRALQENSAHVYFEVLKDCDALAVIFPEIDALFGVPQPEKHHPEIDTGIHTFMCLQQACKLSMSADVRFAVLLHDLGKALTPKELLPKHHGHEQAGVKPVKQLCQRLKVPKYTAKIAEKVCEFHTHCHKAFELTPKTIVKLFTQLDAIRNPQILDEFVIACESDSKGRTGFEDRLYPQAQYLQECLKAAKAVSLDMLTHQHKKSLLDAKDGKKIAEAIHKLRINAVNSVKQQYI